MMEQTEKILKCPICNEKPSLRFLCDGGMSRIIYCKKCRLCTMLYNHENKANNEWNTLVRRIKKWHNDPLFYRNKNELNRNRSKTWVMMK
jgi:hypothetical protein